MNAIEVENLQFSYLGSGKPAINIPNFSIQEGETVLITGKSGSGKSTLVQCINGIIPHLMNGTYKGEVRIFGKPVKEMRVPEISQVVGTLLQDPERQVINYRVEEEIAFAPENFNVDRDGILQRIEESISAVGIGELRGRETGRLSGGELQRVALAAVLSMRPRILILDEPTSNIDPEGTGSIFQYLRSEKGQKTMIIIEHKVERVLPFVDRIVIIDNGKIVLDGDRESLIDEGEKLREMGIEIPEHLIVANRVGIRSFDPVEIRRKAENDSLTIEPKSRAGNMPSLMRADVSVRYHGGFGMRARLDIPAGTITAIMGRNGTGKSSLLKGLIGFLDSDEAEVSTELEIDGKTYMDPDLQTRGRHIGYLPQSFDLMLISKTVDRELRYSTRVRKLKNTDALINSLTDLFSLRDCLKSDPLTLSQGQRRRVAMGATIAGGPRMIMMDEPTSGQDYFHKTNLGNELKALKGMGYSFLIVTHDSRFVHEFADRIVLLDHGEVVLQGTPEEVFTRSEEYGVVPPAEFYLRWKYELPA